MQGKSQLPPAQLAAAQLTQSDWSGSQGRAQLAKVSMENGWKMGDFTSGFMEKDGFNQQNLGILAADIGT